VSSHVCPDCVSKLTRSSGNAAVSLRRNQFVVDNARNGFDLHQLDNAAYIRTFPTGYPLKFLPKQVAFGEDSKVVVGGSDHGAIYVFDRKTGKPLQVLHHGDTGLVQTIAVRLLSNNKRRPLRYRRHTRWKASIP
jgi:hypothetical protein